MSEKVLAVSQQVVSQVFCLQTSFSLIYKNHQMIYKNQQMSWLICSWPCWYACKLFSWYSFFPTVECFILHDACFSSSPRSKDRYDVFVYLTMQWDLSCVSSVLSPRRTEVKKWQTLVSWRITLRKAACSMNNFPHLWAGKCWLASVTLGRQVKETEPM